jgi:peptidyl-prolyl cis-trans isomerase C
MIKIHLFLIILFFSSLLNAEDNNLSTYDIVKINQHKITSKIFTKRKATAILNKFNQKEKRTIINQLINDEIAVQYAFQYMNMEDNISNEKERLSLGLTMIDRIAIKESVKLISDTNISDFYEKNKKKFWHEKQYSASNILLKDKNKTKEIILKLKNSSDLNSTFQILAKKFSKDNKSINGGYMGYFELKTMPIELQKVLKNLKINQYNNTPIKTKFGYHIIYLHKIVEKGYVSLKKVRKLIKLNLANKEKVQWFNKALTPLKEKAKIEYFLDTNNQ